MDPPDDRGADAAPADRARPPDLPAADRPPAADVAPVDATVTDASVDASSADLPRPDAAPSPDAATPCTPTRTSCNAARECGSIPNGCPGGVFRCGLCGGGEAWCAIGEPQWRNRVYNCVQRTQGEHPGWFDPVMFRDTSSWLVLEAQARPYVAAVAQCANGRGAAAVVDSNAPANEVRVRAADGDVAENFIVRPYSTGRTAAHYTSACTPAMF